MSYNFHNFVIRVIGRNMKIHVNRNFLHLLSGGLGAGPAQREVVKMKKKKIPTGLQVHLEDMP